MMKTVAIIQARMGSTRLPGKVMLEIAGRPMLDCVVSRVEKSRTIDDVLIATTTSDTEEPILELCERSNWDYYRGEEHDVLDRYYRAAMECGAETVVRVTSDCPLIDPGLIDKVVETYYSAEVDYASNNLPPRTYPRGLDAEVMSFEVVKQAWKRDHNPDWREHVTPYIYRNPDEFSLIAVRNDVDYSYHRWTVDTESDLELVRKIFGVFQGLDFSWLDVVSLLEDNPKWLEINQDVKQKEID